MTIASSLISRIGGRLVRLARGILTGVSALLLALTVVLWIDSGWQKTRWEWAGEHNYVMLSSRRGEFVVAFLLNYPEPITLESGFRREVLTAAGLSAMNDDRRYFRMRFGIGWRYLALSFNPPHSNVTAHEVGAIVPFWLLCLVWSILPAIWLCLRRRRSRASAGFPVGIASS